MIIPPWKINETQECSCFLDDKITNVAVELQDGDLGKKQAGVSV